MNVSTVEVAHALGLSRKATLERAKKEGWQYYKKGSAMLWIVDRLPEDVRMRLAGQSAAQTAQSPKAFSQAHETERDKARLRAAIINAYRVSSLNVEQFVQAFNAGFISGALRAEYEKTLSAGTFYRWLKSFEEAGIGGLTPLYSQSGKKRGAGASLTETEKETLRFFYLDYNRRSVRHCYLSMKANIPESLATYTTCLRYLQSLPKDGVDLARRGADYFNAKYLPYIERKKTLYHSMQQVQGDHHVIDRVVMYEGRLVRPWLTVFLDMRSAAVLGWCVSTNPNSRTILMSYYMMVVRFGIPEMAHIDNGKDYKGKTIKGQKAKMKVLDDEGIEREEEVIITGALPACGTTVHYARAYHGQSKGVVERFFRVLEEYYGKNCGNYIGSNTASRVDEQKLYWRSMKGFAKRNDVTGWKEFVDEMAHFLQWYNTQWVSDAKDRKAETAEQTFIKNLPPEGLRKPDIQTVQLALTKGEVRKVMRNGIRMGAVNYWAKELTGLVGQHVIARVSLVNANEMMVCDRAGSLLCTAYADAFMESGCLQDDCDAVNAARRDVFHKARELTKFSHFEQKPKTMLEIAMQATGVEVPKVETYVPEAEEKLAAGAENQTKKESRYVSYFNADDDFE